jgi:mannose-6-phosphate isomerase-like protein (cupin superfamily)
MGDGDLTVRILRAEEFTGASAWDALDIERFDAATVRLHWTDQPYIWHVNDGPEVFAVLAGSVRMHYRRDDGTETFADLAPGDLAHCVDGDTHKAEPLVPSRVLVVERHGSV